MPLRRRLGIWLLFGMDIGVGAITHELGFIFRDCGVKIGVVTKFKSG